MGKSKMQRRKTRLAKKMALPKYRLHKKSKEEERKESIKRGLDKINALNRKDTRRV